MEMVREVWVEKPKSLESRKPSEKPAVCSISTATITVGPPLRMSAALCKPHRQNTRC
jgi:hypothetical protein